MFDNEIRAARRLLEISHGVLKDFDETQMTQPVAGAKNPPAFVLCHVLVANDGGLTLLGKPGLCPPEWRRAFGPGADPAAVKIPYPRKAALLSLLQESVGALSAAASAAGPEALNRPHGIPMFAGTEIETVSHVITLLLTGHGAFHLGQLSVMRRQLGFAPLF
jgi:hypothetical protein